MKYQILGKVRMILDPFHSKRGNWPVFYTPEALGVFQQGSRPGLTLASRYYDTSVV